MPTVLVTNRTANRLPVDSFVGILQPNQVRTVELSVHAMELARPALVALAAAGQIVWTVNPSTSNDDNQGEVVTGGGKVLAGVGDPTGVVVGSTGDLFLRKDGGVNTTLYVKESGLNTTAGWAAK